METRLNSPPATGAPSISGTAEVEETLTSGVADEDGLDNADFTYQWQAGRLYMGRLLRRDGQAWSGLVSGLVCPPIPLASCYLDPCLSGEVWEEALHSTTSRTLSEGGGGGEGTVGLDWMAGTYRTRGRGLRPAGRVRAPRPTL